ncbi:MAG TPA: tyrosinase/peptidase [Leucothrix mucor]|nr:tyrosinase/peptidase [Leucothrix mucor]
MAIRKDANTLSSAERTELVDAILQLKAEGIYDQFVLRHANAMMMAIHSCPAFLPWHRRYLWDFEQELQRVSGNPDLGVPYWNWPEGGANAPMWDNDLLGGDGDAGGVVRSGPFRSGRWTIVNSSGSAAGPLERGFGRNTGGVNLPTRSAIEGLLQITPYDASPWNRASNPSFRNEMEGWLGGLSFHNLGHVWVGGSMLPMTSPNDPVFFFHHCMVDKIWHDWQQRFPAQGYVPVTGGNMGQNLTATMDSTPLASIGRRPIDVLDSGAIGIVYDDATPSPPPPPPPEPPVGRVTDLSLNATAISASIATAGEIDEYRFNVVSAGEVTIETSGSSDTFISLFGPNSTTNQIAQNDDGGANVNARLVLSLAVGSYHLAVRLFNSAATGSYAIRVTSEADVPQPPPQPPIDRVTDLSVNASATSASIAVGGEVDEYRFDVASFGEVTIETSGGSDTFITLFGPNNATDQIAQNDDGGDNLNAKITMNLSAGTYHVATRLFSPTTTGSYAIRVSSEADNSSGSQLPELVIDAAETSAAISARSESDVYRFSVVSPGIYSIETTGSTDTFLSLLGPNDESLLIMQDDDSGASFNSRIRRNLAVGEYYARVRHFSADGTGAYSISVKKQ